MDNPQQSPQPSEIVDLTMDDEHVDQPSGDVHMQEPEVVVKQEPDVEMPDPQSSETQLPGLPDSQIPDTELFEALAAEMAADFQSSALDGTTNEDTTAVNDILQSFNTDLLRNFDENSHVERMSTPDRDHEEAMTAVESKKQEIAIEESLGNFDPADQVDLKTLEDALARTKQRAESLREHKTQEHDTDAMFFSDDNVPDEEDVPIIRPPPREEPMEVLPAMSQAEGGEDDSGRSVHAATARSGRKAPSAKSKARKLPVAKGQTKIKKQAQPARSKGRQRNMNMLNFSSLVRNDVVGDAQRNQDLPDEFDFGGAKSKKDALTALVASIPKEHRNTNGNVSKEIDSACKEFHRKGPGSMKPDGNKGWKLKGMASSLKTFQLLSTAWMLRRERGTDAPFGGILADTMGYGKTVQMITVMVEHLPKRKHQTTLIVVPASLVSQWWEEIAKHTEDHIMESVYRYRSRDAGHIPDIVKYLSSYQVVITTYHEVMSNFPKCEPPVHLVTDRAKDAWWDRYYAENCGPLFRMKFFRVILDEAHIIKNHESRTSRACRHLTAKYKWVLTGTPLSNCMEELFPYFHFLSVSGSGSFAQFKHNYARRTDLTTQRLDAILRKVMIRRTGADRLLGRPLTKLPGLDYQTISVPFNAVEKAIYSVVRHRFISCINDWTASGKIGQYKRNLFVMLLRLRQMCAHVLMVTNSFKDLLETEDLQKLWTIIERHSKDAGNSTGKKTATVLRRILRDAQDDEQGEDNSPMRSTDGGGSDTIDLTINDDDFDYRSLFYRLQQDGVWNKIQNRSTCSSCHEAPEDHGKLSVPCGHLYCEACLNILLDSASNHGGAECVVCHNVITMAAEMTAIEQIAAEATQGNQLGIPSAESVPKKSGRKGKEDPDHKWLSIPNCEKLSSKVQAITGQIKEWMGRDPNAKIVVFTLFIPIVKILSKVCVKERWGYEQFTGQMSTDQRNRNLKRWKDPAEARQVLLMSMRAGGLGLNLTEASYVIIVDPWWNEPAEDQAFSRVYRIGQPKNCVVRRFVIADAIDTQLMLYLQELKAQECDRVIDGRSQTEMSVHDLLKLFGPTRRDPTTNEVIVEDGEAIDETDEFVIGEDGTLIDDSDVEEIMPAPGRPRES